MKFIPFKIFILFIALPPFYYISTILIMERYLERRYQKEVRDICIGDAALLLSGNRTLQDAISSNINAFLKKKTEIKWGVNTRLVVATRQGTILYPAIFDNKVNGSIDQYNPKKIAAENYRMMNEGLIVTTDVKITHFTPISYVLLFLYICMAASFLYYLNRANVRKASIEERMRKEKIDRLIETEKKHIENIQALINDRERLNLEIKEIKKKLEKEKLQASKNEDEMINEIIVLEQNIQKNIKLQKEKEIKILDLQENLRNLDEKEKKYKKPKKNRLQGSQKRFNALYQNIILNQRALSGFNHLTEGMKIKAEEIIKKLNDNYTVVPIKRKIFGKKNRKTVQEVIFSYKGRLYFQQLNDNRIEILAIGTKNTQLKDLEFIDNL